MTRALRRHLALRERARMRRLLLGRFSWGCRAGADGQREPTIQELAKFAAVSPKPCGGGGRCPQCDGAVPTASTRRRAASVQPETEQ